MGSEMCIRDRLYEGQTDAALRVITAIRDRYDGASRNPFDEAECGHHYARAMAAWGAVLAITGFQYSGVRKSLTLAARPDSTLFWSNGSAWGICRQSGTNGSTTATLEVLSGSIEIAEFSLTGLGNVCFDAPKLVNPAETLTIDFSQHN